jgi:hypothetical protein
VGDRLARPPEGATRARRRPRAACPACGCRSSASSSASRTFSRAHARASVRSCRRAARATPARPRGASGARARTPRPAPERGAHRPLASSDAR